MSVEAVPGTAGELRCTDAGGALLLHAADGPGELARRLAGGIADDPEHTVVVADLPAAALPPTGRFADAAAHLLAGRPGGFRLVVASGDGPAATAAAQWLAHRLGRPVVSHDGAFVPVGVGGLFVPADPGRAGWVEFRPDAPARSEGHRFPRPAWDPLPVNTIARAGSSVVEPVPGGIWFRRMHTDPVEPRHRRALIEAMVVQHEVLTVVLGSPGSPPLDLEDVARVWRALPPRTRVNTRFLEFGPVDKPAGVATGTALAALVGEPVTFYTGLPAAPRPELDRSGQIVPRAVRDDGRPGGYPFAGQLGFAPEGGAPRLAAHRRPVADDVPEVAPGTYEIAPDAVLEVIAAGLWVRPPELPDSADEVRSALMDPVRLEVVYEARTPEMARRLRRVAQDTAGRLEVGPGSEVVVRAHRSAGAAEPAAASAPAAPAEPAPVDGGLPAGMRIEAAAPVLGEAPALPASVAIAGPASLPGTAAVSASGATPAVLPGPPAPVFTPAGGSPVLPPAAPVPATGSHAGGLPAGPAASPHPPAGPSRTSAGALPGPVAPPHGPATPHGPAGSPPSGPAAPHGPVGSPPSGPVPGGLPSAAPGSGPAGTPLAAAPPAGAAPGPVAPGGTPATAAPPVIAAEPAVGAPAAPTASSAVAASGAPAPARTAARPQPVPADGASLVPPESGLAAEREWLRRSFQAEYDSDAGTVAAVLSRTPGLRAGANPGEVALDLVAVRLYLRGDSTALARAAHSGRPGPHVPLGRCVAAGLSRLPSNRGAVSIVVGGGSAADAAAFYREHTTVTEWSMLDAWADRAPAGPGQLEVRIWSSRGRRTQLLEPGVPGRVVFLPGTAFRVLSVLDATDGAGPVVLLRELVGSPEPAGRSPFDDVAEAGLARSAEARKDRAPDENAPLGHAPGLRWVEVPR